MVIQEQVKLYRAYLKSIQVISLSTGVGGDRGREIDVSPPPVYLQVLTHKYQDLIWKLLKLATPALCWYP